MIKIKIIFIASIWFSAMGACFSTFANPEGGAIVNGQIAITTPNAETTVVNQTSHTGIINWQTFNIGKNEATHFNQPQGGITLNRINAANGASQIYGVLTASGRIVLVNGAGIYFGPSAYVNVGGLIASTANISDVNFLNGNYHFQLDGTESGSIINAGKIIAINHGLIALMGENVTNSGMIQANLGHVVLASGDAFTVTFAGSSMIAFTVDEKAMNATVSNSGHITANGGTVLVAAKTASSVLDHVINMSGIIETNSVGQQNGEIILMADNGAINVSGSLIAQGNEQGEFGGKVSIYGSEINLLNNASIDVSGFAGGGAVIVSSTEHTLITANASINANALDNGNGGNVLVWSNAETLFYGSINAEAGVKSGNGGFVETSGRYLAVTGSRINLHAVHGVTGTWLLDPENLTIQNAGVTTATASGVPTNTYTSNIDNSILTVADLENALSNASVLVKTGSGGAQAGNIAVADALTWNNANTLTLSAFNNILVNAAITNSAGGSLMLRADNSGSGAGTIIFSGVAPQISLSGGGNVNFYYNPTSFATPTNFSPNVSVSGGSGFTAYMLVNSAAALQNINTNLSGNYALSKDITLSGNFTPLGTSASPYTGIFTGLGNTISNLNITVNTPIDVGLFGAVSGGTLTDLNLSDPVITVTASVTNLQIYIGSLVGFSANELMQNILVLNPTVTASGTNFGTNGSLNEYGIGGLAGGLSGGSMNATGTISGSITSHVVVNTVGSMEARNAVGGLVGIMHNSALIDNSFSSSDVSVDGSVLVPGAGGYGQAFTGGLVGRLDTNSVIQNSFSAGTVNVSNTLSVTSTGTGLIQTGGLVGNTSVANSGPPVPPPNINNSFSLSNVIVNANIVNSPGTDAEVITGGLFGQSNAVVANSYSNGSVVTSLTSDATSFGTAFYTGGVAGVAFTIMTNTYSLSPVTVSGINKGGQFYVGGFAGEFITLFDKEILTSFSAGTVTVNATNQNGGLLYVGGFVGTWVYYGGAATTWPFMNNYSFSNLVISGTNNASTAAIGGFMGANGQDAGDPGGNIVNAYSAGTINNSLTTTNAGVTDLGGFIGLNVGASATLNNNFWDTTTSNLTQGVGNTPGAVSGLTAGCFSGSCQPNGGTANLSQQSTYAAAGWNFASIWSIRK